MPPLAQVWGFASQSLSRFSTIGFDHIVLALNERQGPRPRPHITQAPQNNCPAPAASTSSPSASACFGLTFRGQGLIFFP